MRTTSKNQSRDDIERYLCSEIIFQAKKIHEAVGGRTIPIVPGNYTKDVEGEDE